MPLYGAVGMPLTAPEPLCGAATDASGMNGPYWIGGAGGAGWTGGWSGGVQDAGWAGVGWP